MKIIDCEQGSEAWVNARLGIPTASQFNRLLTKSGKPSASAEGYLDELAAEWMLGCSIDEGSSGFMERGSNLERQARAAYELERGVDVDVVGFCAADDGLCGCSPDSLIGDDGGLEIKIPGIKGFVRAMRKPESFAGDHWQQVQGSMMVTGRSWWDLMAWHGEFDPVIVRCERDDEKIDALAAAVVWLSAELDEFLVRAGYRQKQEVA